MPKKNSNLEPMPGRVIIRREEAKNRTEGGIVLPDSAKEQLNRGVVLAVGKPLLKETTDETNQKIRTYMPDLSALQVKEGDVVIFPHYNAQQIELDGEELLVVHVTDLLAKVVA